MPAESVERVPLDTSSPTGGRLTRSEVFRGWAFRDQVRQVAEQRQVDVVHVTHQSLTPAFARVVVTAWDPLMSPWARYRAAPERGEKPRVEAAYAVADAVAFRRAAAIIAITSRAAGAARVFRRPVRWIPPFLPDAGVRPPAGGRGQNVLLIANGIDSERKGLELAVNAVDDLRTTRPEIRLTLVGTWSNQGRASELPPFCDVRGYVERDRLLEMLPGFGCCVIPSRWEEFGYAGLEALAAGVPLACAPELGIADFAGHGVFVAPRRIPEALAAAIGQALDADDFEFPRPCRESDALPKIEELYEQLAGGG
jgi:glycosyltransferase involved in cell wall biosynthesis